MLIGMYTVKLIIIIISPVISYSPPDRNRPACIGNASFEASKSRE